MPTPEQCRKILEAAKEWMVDRIPNDPAEKMLAVAIFRAYPEERCTRETCECAESETCDECPTDAQVETTISAWEQQATT